MSIPANINNMLEQLAECKAVLVSRKSFVASGFKRLRRCWPDARMEYMDDYETYLLTYCDAKNGSTASTTVDTPLVDGKPISGIWTCGVVVSLLGGLHWNRDCGNRTRICRETKSMEAASA